MRLTKIITVLLLAMLYFACQPQGGGKGDESGQEVDTTTAQNEEGEKEDDEEDEGHELELPRPSPKGAVEQVVGLTEIEIEYYRPSVRGRQIWGQLVPYDEMWRTGANKATSISFEDDVTINGQKLEAGKYSFFTIPGKNEWTVIFNKKTDMWGTSGYDKANDALRFKVKPFETSHHEMMTFSINNVAPDTATIALMWKKTGIQFGVHINTHDKVMANIKKAIDHADGDEDDWRLYAQAASYCVDNDVELDKAEKWINKSISIKEHWWNMWTKAELMVKKENYKKAVEIGNKAIKVGEEQEGEFGYKDRLQRQVKKWQEKI